MTYLAGHICRWHSCHSNMKITVIWLQQVTSALDAHAPVTVAWKPLSCYISKPYILLIFHWPSWCSFHNNMKIVVISQQQNKSVAYFHVSVALKWRWVLLTFTPALVDTSTDSSISGDHSLDHSNRTRESTVSGPVYAPRIQYVLSAWTAAGSCCWLKCPRCSPHHPHFSGTGLLAMGFAVGNFYQRWCIQYLSN